MKKINTLNLNRIKMLVFLLFFITTTLVISKVVAIEKIQDDNDQISIIRSFDHFSNVIVKYLDDETGEEIINSEKISGKIGDDYITKDKIVQINEIPANKYILISNTDNVKGKIAADTIEVIYFYKRVQAQGIVKYIDEESGEEIRKREYIGGNIGVEYKTDPKSIKEYDLVIDKIPNNQNGKFDENITEIIYYYKKKYVPINTGDMAFGLIIFLAITCTLGIAYVVYKNKFNKK